MVGTEMQKPSLFSYIKLVLDKSLPFFNLRGFTPVTGHIIIETF